MILHRNEFDADQVNVMTGARRDTFANNRRERIGVFAEWEGAVSRMIRESEDLPFKYYY